MNVIIVGNGKVGNSLAQHLSLEDHSVVIVDNDDDELEKSRNYLDVMCIHGSGVSTQILLEAGIEETDLLIATTTNDETNIVCCLLSKALGAAHTVARIRDPEYSMELADSRNPLDLDLIINPERAVASEIANLLKFPAAIDIELFAEGNVEIIEVIANSSWSVIDRPIKSFSRKLKGAILIGIILRKGEVVIPTGDTIIKEGDQIFLVGHSAEIYHFCQQIGVFMEEIRKTMIMGGGRSTVYLTRYLEKLGMEVCVLEKDYHRCTELSELLPNTLIIHGDGSDALVLESENIDQMDAFVAVTGFDEENLITGLVAKEYGVGKVVAKINRIAHQEVLQKVGIDNIVNPKRIVTEHILRYARNLNSSDGNPLQSLYQIADYPVEMVEFIVAGEVPFLNIPLKKLNLIPDLLVAAIVRDGKTLIPRGNDSIHKNDYVVLITKNRKLSDLNDILAKEDF